MVDESLNANEVRYYLKSSTFTVNQEISEPLNWNTDEKELSRSSDSYGVFTTQSGDLEFVGKGAELISSVYQQYGTEIDLSLLRYVKGGLNEGWLFDYEADFDLKTYSYDGVKVSVQFLTGGLQSIIEAQKREDYELERTTDIDGNVIDSLTFDTLINDGRNIFLESQQIGGDQDDDYNPDERTYVMERTLFNQEYKSALTTLVYESDDYFASMVNNSMITLVPSASNYINASDFFYIAETSATRTVKVVIGKLSVLSVDNGGLDITGTPSVNVYLIVFNVDPETGVISNPRGVNSSGNIVSGGEGVYHLGNVQLGEETSIYYEEDIYIEENTAISLIYMPTSYGVTLDLFEKGLVLDFSENSFYETTTNPIIKTYDVGNRLAYILSGRKNAFKSSVFGGTEHGYSVNGKWSRTAIASGYHIRNIPEATTTLNINDFFSLNDYFNLGWGVENVDGAEKWVVEEKKYFFQDTLVCDLGEVSNFTIEAAEDMLYRSLTFGYKDAGDYEEVQGLQEFNTETTYQTYLKTAEQEYDVQGEIRADNLGMELARREQYINSPDEDTTYDEDNFLIHLSDNSDTLRRWQEDFDEEPICYDPDSAFNLMLTPLRSMYRHAYWFNCGLTRNLDQYTRYSSGSGADMYSKTESEAYARNIQGDTKNTLLEKPLIKAEYITFDLPVDFDLKRLIFGNTKIDGRKVPNTNLLYKCSYRGTDYFGWIVNLKLNDPGEWKLILKY